MKRSPLKRKTPLRAKNGFKRSGWVRTPDGASKPAGRGKALRIRSNKRATEERKYNAEAKAFLSAFPSPCIVMRTIFKKEGFLATQIHHCAGREGDLLRYKPFWLAVSAPGHDWIHQNPNKAREYGWIFEAIKLPNGTYAKRSR